MAKNKEAEVSPEAEKTESAPPPAAPEPSCGTCANRRGDECHFLPPQVISAVFATWSPVKETDWCRQWEAK